MFCRDVTISVTLVLSSFLQYNSPVSEWREIGCTHGMKKNHMYTESLQRTKVAFGLFLPCVIIKKCNCNTFPSQPLLPSQNKRIQYITFVLLHLNCKKRGGGTEIWIYQVYTERTVKLFVFFPFLYWRPPKLPSQLIFTSPRALSSEVRGVGGVGGGEWMIGDEGRLSLNHSSSPLLVCLWCWQLCWGQRWLPLCRPASGPLHWCRTRWPCWDRPGRSSAGKGRWRTPHLEHRWEKKKSFRWLSVYQPTSVSGDVLVAQGDAPSLRQPILYIMGILMTKANRSSINVLRAL